ncbi:hypothetical protein QE152_g14134 [Popillia japonica]|uniref:Uncharacterized protein n=1 Tax=Popillia japonica TaxID=7064 RepID=A0AAW1LB79_POPJA
MGCIFTSFLELLPITGSGDHSTGKIYRLSIASGKISLSYDHLAFLPYSTGKIYRLPIASGKISLSYDHLAFLP